MSSTMPPRERLLVIASSRKLRADWLALTRTSVDFDYACLFQKLGLSPAQRERFKAILVNGQEGELDLALSAAGQGVPWSSPSLIELKEAVVNQSIKQPMDALLGADYAAFIAYRDELPAWQLVGQVTAMSSYESIPLSEGQSDRLEKILASSSGHATDGSVVPNTVNWTAALPAAALVLNSNQYRSLEQLAAANSVSLKLEQSVRAIVNAQ